MSELTRAGFLRRLGAFVTDAVVIVVRTKVLSAICTARTFSIAAVRELG